jgi:hypothetical protein
MKAHTSLTPISRIKCILYLHTRGLLGVKGKKVAKQIVIFLIGYKTPYNHVPLSSSLIDSRESHHIIHVLEQGMQLSICCCTSI